MTQEGLTPVEMTLPSCFQGARPQGFQGNEMLFRRARWFGKAGVQVLDELLKYLFSS